MYYIFMSSNLDNMSKLWKTLTSPKVVSVLKLGVAIIGVIRAVDEIATHMKVSEDSETEE